MRWLLLLLLTLPAWGADWSHFRGPAGDGFTPETRLRTNWAAHPPKIRWTVPLSDQGFAGPAVVGGVVYIMDHQGTQDLVRALDLRTGHERWRYAYPDATTQVYGYARATPAVVGGAVYTLSRLGKVHCLDARTGTVYWMRDLVQAFHGALPQWGYSMSPCVDGDTLVFCPGGKGAAVVALDRHTGATRWQGGGDDAPGYATPVVAMLNGERQYVIFAGAALLGVAARTGALRWRFPWATDLDKEVDTAVARAHFNANAAVPVVIGNTVFITTGYGHGSALVDVTGNKPVVRWSTTALQSQYTSPIVADGYVYCTTDPRGLRCLDLRTGKVAWQHDAIGRGGGLAAAKGLLFVMDGLTGAVILVRLSPKGYTELGHVTPLAGENRTAPVLADGCLLVRNRKALACLDIALPPRANPRKR